MREKWLPWPEETKCMQCGTGTKNGYWFCKECWSKQLAEDTVGEALTVHLPDPTKIEQDAS